MPSYLRIKHIMKSSQYNIFISYKNNDYIYNTLTTALLRLPQAIRIKIEQNELTKIETDLLNKLVTNGIIVDDNLNELSVYRYYYNSIQYSEIHDELKIVYVPTYNCNLKCFYCFEESSNKIINQPDKTTIEQLILFIKNQLVLHPTYKKLSLILFGGEPLICKNQCIDLCKKLSILLHEKNITFNPKIITNATLLDEKVVEELIIPYNMNIQITLDGVKDIHDQRKIYKNGNGTYKQIYFAIDLLNKLGYKDNIDLRLNIDKNNIHCIEPIFQKFHNKVKLIYIGLLRPYGNNKCNFESCISQNEFHINYKKQVLPILKKYNMIDSLLDVTKQHPCGMNRLNTFIIDTYLDVYKCENLLGDKNHVVGHIVNGELKKYPAYYQQVAWTPFNSKCNKCSLLPACAGSCPYLCLMENGDINMPLCSLTKDQLIKKICLYIDEINE